jgi:hypothetical protein
MFFRIGAAVGQPWKNTDFESGLAGKVVDNILQVEIAVLGQADRLQPCPGGQPVKVLEAGLGQRPAQLVGPSTQPPASGVRAHPLLQLRPPALEKTDHTRDGPRRAQRRGVKVDMGRRLPSDPEAELARGCQQGLQALGPVRSQRWRDDFAGSLALSGQGRGDGDWCPTLVAGTEGVPGSRDCSD